MSMSELLKAVWDFDISICPDCGHSSMKQLGRCYAPSWSSWLLILFWKSLPTGGFESMSCNVLHHKNQRVFSWFLIIFDDFGHLGTIQSPYKNWLKYRDWVQYERITFRAVPIYCRTALFVNSESDTFLMNYSTFPRAWKYAVFMCFSCVLDIREQPSFFGKLVLVRRHRTLKNEWPTARGMTSGEVTPR